jgi:hypothetical protein
MHTRCYNPNHQQYKDYGGRGIVVCSRWHQFVLFFEDMGQPPSQSHTLDRRNNDLGYSLANCRWATRKEQARNSRNVRLLTYKGKTQTLSEWAAQFGVHRAALLYHLNRKNRTFEETVNYYTRNSFLRYKGKGVRLLTHREQTKSLKDWAAFLGVSVTSLNYHLKKGRTLAWVISYFMS